MKEERTEYIRNIDWSFYLITIDQSEVNRILLPLSLVLGEWNEVRGIDSSAEPFSIRAPQEYSSLFRMSVLAASWVTSIASNWVLLQLDNSTFPAEDEVVIFHRIFLSGKVDWDPVTQRSFLFRHIGVEKQSVENNVLTAILLTVAYEWHIYIVPDDANDSRRLAVQDGVLHFFGKENAVEEARILLSNQRGRR